MDITSPPLSKRHSLGKKVKRASVFRGYNIRRTRANKGRYVVESGELMCRYEIDGGLCPANNRFKAGIELRKHLKENHTADTYIKATRTGVNKNLFLTRFDTDIVAAMQGTPFRAQPASACDSLVPQCESPAPVHIATADDSDEDDSNSEQEDSSSEDDDDDADAHEANDNNDNAPAGVNSAPKPPGKYTSRSARLSAPGITTFNYSGTIIDPLPHIFPEVDPSKLPAFAQRSIHDHCDSEKLRKAKAEAAKLERFVSSENSTTGPGSLVEALRENRRKFGGGLRWSVGMWRLRGKG